MYFSNKNELHCALFVCATAGVQFQRYNFLETSDEYDLYFWSVFESY